MKGLVLKDFYAVGSFWKSFLPMVALLALQRLALRMDESFVTIISLLIAVMFVMQLGFVDERSEWDRYVTSRYAPRMRVVSARYIVALAIMLAGVACGVAINVVCNIVLGQAVFNFSSMLLLAASIITAVFVAAVMLPVNYKLGAYKARFVVAVIFLVPYMVLVLNAKKIVGWGGTLPAGSGFWLMCIAFAAAGLCYAVSWLASAAVYKNKEF